MNTNRQLVLELLRQYRIRGYLFACLLCDDSLHIILSCNDIKIEDAVNCILIYLFWFDVIDAEEWNYNRGRRPPIDAGQTIDLLADWYLREVSYPVRHHA